MLTIGMSASEMTEPRYRVTPSGWQWPETAELLRLVAGSTSRATTSRYFI